MAEKLEAALRNARSRITESDRQSSVEVIREELDRAGLLRAALISTIQKTPMRDLPVAE